MSWHVKKFDQLSVFELYAILRLRIAVFAVEQDCVYQDADNKDYHPETLHVFNIKGDEVTAYLRIMAPGCSYQGQSSIGRVVTCQSARGSGIGHQLLQRGLKEIDRYWPKQGCHISAQAYLIKFYSQHSFCSLGETYLEDGIDHIAMERQPSYGAN